MHSNSFDKINSIHYFDEGERIKDLLEYLDETLIAISNTSIDAFFEDEDMPNVKLPIAKSYKFGKTQDSI